MIVGIAAGAVVLATVGGLVVWRVCRKDDSYYYSEEVEQEPEDDPVAAFLAAERSRINADVSQVANLNPIAEGEAEMGIESLVVTSDIDRLE
jgi:hypothetical protein